MLLLFQLSKQIVLPNRKRKGNLLNVLFLLYIGIIETIQHFEHRQFKMADWFQNRLKRKGLMLCTFLLFFLTSYEQPAVTRFSPGETAKMECSCQSTVHTSLYIHCIKPAPAQKNSFLQRTLNFCCKHYSEFVTSNGSKLYLQNHRLLI